MTHHILLFLHLISAVVWVGGMFFAYFCLRPAAVAVLEPAMRLPLWAATFQRFFQFAALAVVLLVLTGLGMLLQVGFRYAPLGWNLMMALGLTMGLIFVYIYAVAYRRLRHHCAAAEWKLASVVLNQIRKLVGINLVLAGAVLVAAAFSR
jgi:uncharacterized membrane protein